MGAQPIYTQIKPGVAWYKDVADFAAKGGVGLPGSASLPYKPWRDPQAFVAGAWSWWGGAGVVTPIAQHYIAQHYQFVARKSDHGIMLCAIDSPEFFRSYPTLAQVNTYRERKFLFPHGVPYLVTAVVPPSMAEINLHNEQPGYVDYPIELRSDHILVPDAKQPGGVAVWQYQEFLQATKPPAAGPDEVIKRIQGVLGSPMSSENKIEAIRVLITREPEYRLV